MQWTTLLEGCQWNGRFSTALGGGLGLLRGQKGVNERCLLGIGASLEFFFML